MQTFLLAALAAMTLYSVLAVLFIIRKSEKVDRAAVPVRIKVKR